MYEDYSATRRFSRRTLTGTARLLRALRLDATLLAYIGSILAFGLFVLYSASGDNSPCGLTS